MTNIHNLGQQRFPPQMTAGTSQVVAGLMFSLSVSVSVFILDFVFTVAYQCFYCCALCSNVNILTIYFLRLVLD